MAISERLQKIVEQRARQLTEDDLRRIQSRTPEDWTRRGIEDMVRQDALDARALPSQGSLRFHGSGVSGHRAELSAVTHIASSWQKCVTAVGAALEDIKSVRGRLPGQIVERTSVMLEAAPAPGSVVFNLTPKLEGIEEVQPDGHRPLDEWVTRPLVDRATERLLELISSLSSSDLDEVDDLARALKELGPRVGTSLAELSLVIGKSGISVDSSWAEPDHDTSRSTLTPGQARWLGQFIAARRLTEDEEVHYGQLATISSRDKLLLETDAGEELRIDGTGVPDEQLKTFSLYDRVKATVKATYGVRADGTSSSSYKLLRVESAPLE